MYSVLALPLQLQGVCVDHVSDAFIAMWDPVDDLEEVAQKGRRGRVEQCAEALEEHSARILKVTQNSTHVYVTAHSV